MKYRIQAHKKITILIPTRDRVELLSRCIDTLEKYTDSPAYEVVILDNDSADQAAVRYLSEIKHRVLKYEGPFNFAAICNFGVRESDGEWVLFLNNDTEFTEPGWLAAMAEHVQRPEVGAVGAMLLFPSPGWSSMRAWCWEIRKSRRTRISISPRSRWRMAGSSR